MASPSRRVQIRERVVATRRGSQRHVEAKPNKDHPNLAGQQGLVAGAQSRRLQCPDSGQRKQLQPEVSLSQPTTLEWFQTSRYPRSEGSRLLQFGAQQSHEALPAGDVGQVQSSDAKRRTSQSNERGSPSDTQNERRQNWVECFIHARD